VAPATVPAPSPAVSPVASPVVPSEAAAPLPSEAAAPLPSGLPPVSFWEGELGGICASAPRTNRRLTLVASAFGDAGDYGLPALSQGVSQGVSHGRLASVGEDDADGEAAAKLGSLDVAIDSGGDGGGMDDDNDHGGDDEAAALPVMLPSQRGSAGDAREWYTFGIIDILQKYNMQKYLEGGYKSKVLGKQGVSSVSAPNYAKRFVAFLDQHTA